MNKCVGCGITLQNKDQNLLGYTNNLNNKYCERCFRTINYNEEKKVNDFDNSKIITKINKLGIFTIFMTDLFNLNSDLINIYKLINNKKVLIINKSDIIPKNLKLENIKQNIQKVFNIKEDIIFISAKKNINIKEIINLVNLNEKVIFCGESGSGKSTIINKLFNFNLTTSKYKNTTLDFIKLKYQDYLIYDSPGIIVNHNNIDKIKESIKKLNINYIYNIDNIKIKGEGNITCFLNSNIVINSKKNNDNLKYNYEFNKNSDIELDNGFIFIPKGTKIYTDKKLKIRDSIIK